MQNLSYLLSPVIGVLSPPDLEKKNNNRMEFEAKKRKKKRITFMSEIFLLFIENSQDQENCFPICRQIF